MPPLHGLLRRHLPHPPLLLRLLHTAANHMLVLGRVGARSPDTADVRAARGGASGGLQWGQGKAREDHMHIVAFEERSWVFIDIYHGFNDLDATDFLVLFVKETCKNGKKVVVPNSTPNTKPAQEEEEEDESITSAVCKALSQKSIPHLTCKTSTAVLDGDTVLTSIAVTYY